MPPEIWADGTPSARQSSPRHSTRQGSARTTWGKCVGRTWECSLGRYSEGTRTMTFLKGTLCQVPCQLEGGCLVSVSPSSASVRLDCTTRHPGAGRCAGRATWTLPGRSSRSAETSATGIPSGSSKIWGCLFVRIPNLGCIVIGHHKEANLFFRGWGGPRALIF